MRQKNERGREREHGALFPRPEQTSFAETSHILRACLSPPRRAHAHEIAPLKQARRPLRPRAHAR